MPREPITVISSITREYTLLPHFIEYYLSLNVDRFVIACFPEQFDALTEACKDWPVKVVLFDPEYIEERIERKYMNDTRRDHVHEGWVIPADLDEFHQYPAPLEEMLHGDYSFGFFVDRLSATGELTADQPEESLWDQYPLECDITKDLVQGCLQKVVLARWDVPLYDGHHDVTDCTKVLYNQDSRTHHFKWRAGTYEALVERVERYKKADIFFYTESQRAIDYLDQHQGRFNPMDFNARPGWKPGLQPATL